MKLEAELEVQQSSTWYYKELSRLIYFNCLKVNLLYQKEQGKGTCER